MNRRRFLQATGALVAVAGHGLARAAVPQQNALDPKLPRWRGFNLTENVSKWGERTPPYRESDFKLLQKWGFNFARLPLSYLLWTEPNDWLKVREEELRDIDEGVAL